MKAIFLILFSLGFAWRFEIVGDISMSELVLIGLSPVILYRIHPFRNKQMGTFLKFYLALIAVQVLMESIVGNEVENSMRGIAVSIVSLLHTCFLYLFFRKDRHCLAWVALGYFLRNLFFPSEFLEDVVGEDTFESVFLKFQLAPMMFGAILFLGTYLRIRLFHVLVIVAGIAFVIMGARSFGVICIISGVITFLIKRRKGLRIPHFKTYIIVALLLLYGGYRVYVDQVLEGKIDSGNSSQLMKVEDPYNPVNLLMMGRTEVWVGYMAMTEQPITGWGAWTIDPDNRFRYMEMDLRDEDFRELNDEQVIPSHSVIIGYGMQNGIFAMLLVITLAVWIMRKGILLLRYGEEETLIVTFLLAYFAWNVLFSPISHFRLDLPIVMSFILASWELKFGSMGNTRRGNPVVALGDVVSRHEE
ncbi:MAG: hypothetical protein J6I60_07805 [Bacteroidaceae bacterium]|nr:hypothetical protein [Bacteroidaceae bacterium]